MRSSESTRPRSRSPFPPLFLEVVGDDHPKACTGRRLLHRGLVRQVPHARSLHPPPVVLDPYAEKPLSVADRAAARRGGVLAVDCSWNRLATRGHLHGHDQRPHVGLRRRLPILVAANPQHYGRVAELNTAEALSAALYVLGYPAPAASLLAGLRGGEGFLEINRLRLDSYASARDSEEIRQFERALFGGSGTGPLRAP